MNSNKVKILICDDHPLFRAGVKQTLLNNKSFEIYEAEEGNEAIKKILDIKPEAAVIDIRMPGKSGLEILSEMCALNISTKIILLTMYKNINYFYQAVSLGAKGYLLKETAVDDLIIAVETVLSDKVFISPRMQILINKTDQKKQVIGEIISLTKTEKEIVKLISEWRTNSEIAEILSNSVRTIENHRANISDKLNLQGSHSLIKFAIENRELF